MRILIFLLTSFSFVAISANGQTQKAKDSLMKVMVAEACSEIKKKDFSTLQKDEIEMEIGMAIIPVFSTHADGIKEILNLDITDGENMKEFGQTLGMKLAMECPDFMRIVSGSKTFKDEFKKEGSSKSTFTVSGTLVKVVPGELTHFIIRDAQGKTEKIWWMEYFDGADKLKDAKNLNKSITIKYKESEIYSAAMKDYIKIKIAIGLDK